MHFPIIKLEAVETRPEDWDTSLNEEDSVLCENTDYYGSIYSEEDRKNVINSSWLWNFLRGIANLDVEKETITFLDKDIVEKTIQDYLVERLDILKDRAVEGKLRLYELRSLATDFRDCSTLFYYEYGMTSFDFVDEGRYMPNTTFRIGNIFDAHI